MLKSTPGNPTSLHTRRDFLRVGGGLAVTGLVLPWAPGRIPAVAGAGEYSTPVAGRARTCILVYLLGGPPHIDMFDLKPDAPSEYRGPFRPIPTNVSGIQICEHLPGLARIADKYALIRSVSRKNSNHTPMIYYTLTGRDTEQPDRDNDVRPPQRTDFPHVGSVMARFQSAPAGLPGFIALPSVAIRSSTSGEFKRARTPLRGGGAGFLGPQFEALDVEGEPGALDAIPALSLPDGVSRRRFESRSELLSILDRRGPAALETLAAGEMRKRAVVLTGSANQGKLGAFTLDGEPPAIRDRYGRHRFGQSLLLARRLAEAGVPMVAVHFNEMTVCDGWDTHSKNFEACRDELLPMLDQGLSALLEDLDARGRLGETLVVCMGEFGRTPRINANAGRDHWGDCSSALLAGGGIRGGQVIGASDRIAAYPVADPVDPADIHATMYHSIGLDPRLTITDLAGRPWDICTGKVIRQLI